MKYTVSIEIARPRATVVQLLADSPHLSNWLRGLVSHEPSNGARRQVGTTSRGVLQVGQQTMEGAEAFTRREPESLHEMPTDTVVRYEREILAEGMWNAARERLTEAGPETTLWESENEYRFSGMSMRLVAPFPRSVFRKKSLQHMRDFKAFAEHGTDVREATG